MHFVNFFKLISKNLIKLYIPMQLPIKECGLHKDSDLLLGDHVCEKSDAVK